jgi:hypothetical protein
VLALPRPAQQHPLRLLQLLLLLLLHGVLQAR